jgi:hypothetical protein
MRIALWLVIGALLATPTTRSVAQDASESPSAHEHMPGMQTPETEGGATISTDDERLTALLIAMRNSEGQEKANAVAAVVEELVAQHRKTRARMSSLPRMRMCGMPE